MRGCDVLVTFGNRFRRDDGIAMVAVLMMIMALIAVGFGAIQVAEHANDITTVDRERLQTVSSAEAGVNAAIRAIEVASSPASVCNGTLGPVQDLMDGDQLVGQYQTKISPDASVPPDQYTCVIDSWGIAPTGGTRAMRHLEVQVKLVPKSGFPFTLFAEGTIGTIYVKNTGTINGDIYAENVDQSKNNVFADDVITTGSIDSLNNGVYSGDIWAAGHVNLASNSIVGGSVSVSGTAGTGNVTLGSGTVVNGDVLAKGTITNNNGTILGASSSSNPNVPSPPNLVKPTFDESELTPYTYDNGTASNVNSELSTRRNNLSGTFRYTGTGMITIPNNVTVNGNTWIVSRGSIDLGSSMTLGPNCQSPNPPCTVALVALGQAGGYQAAALDVSKAFTGAAGLHIIMYTLEGFDAKNSMTFTGSVYADAIDAKNTLTVTGSDVLAINGPTGFHWDFSSSSAYAIVPTLWREVPTGTPS